MNQDLEQAWAEAERRLAEEGSTSDARSYIAAIRRRRPGVWPGACALSWWREAPSGPAEAQNRSETASGADPVAKTLLYLGGLREAERAAVSPVTDPEVRTMLDAYPKIGREA